MKPNSQSGNRPAPGASNAIDSLIDTRIAKAIQALTGDLTTTIETNINNGLSKYNLEASRRDTKTILWTVGSCVSAVILGLLVLWLGPLRSEVSSQVDAGLSKTNQRLSRLMISSKNFQIRQLLKEFTQATNDGEKAKIQEEIKEVTREFDEEVKELSKYPGPLAGHTAKDLTETAVQIASVVPVSEAFDLIENVAAYFSSGVQEAKGSRWDKGVLVWNQNIPPEFFKRGAKPGTYYNRGAAKEGEEAEIRPLGSPPPNLRVQEIKLENGLQQIGGFSIRNATFDRTLIIYRGGSFELKNVRFKNCIFEFHTAPPAELRPLLLRMVAGEAITMTHSE